MTTTKRPSFDEVLPAAQYVFGDGSIYKPIPEDLARFSAKVQAGANGCWIWQASLNAAGYGTFGLARRSVLAHRFAYMMLVGPVADGLELDHLCRVRSCVYPQHLEPVTSGVNVRRGLVGSWNRVKTHCPKGHAYDEANTGKWAGRRHCRACNKQARAEYQARVKAAREQEWAQQEPCPHVSRDGNSCTKPLDHDGKHYSSQYRRETTVDRETGS